METIRYDFIIIGGGIAGLTAAQYGSRSNMHTLVIEAGACGGQALNIFNLENYPGLFPPVDGSEFMQKMETQAKEFGADIMQASVESLDKTGDLFTIKTSKGFYTAPAVLIATGADHRHLGIPGEEKFTGTGVSYCATCDGPFFRNKRVAVIGGGDSACDEALYLSGLTPQVTLIHRKGQLRAQKVSADRVLSSDRISVKFNTVVREIRGTTKVQSLLLENTKTGEQSEFPVDGVFVFIGMDPRTSLVNTLERDEIGCIVTNCEMETAVPGLFCAGDVRSKSFRQLVTAASDGAIAAHNAEKYIQCLNNEVYA
jgi:thioredoxin reductase (NADPH)